MKQYKYIIIGGGTVAGYAAQTFVEEGVEPEEVAILSAETNLPYDRPPLSKAFLEGEENQTDLRINDPDFYTENGISLYLNHPVTQVDMQECILTTEHDDQFGFDKLLIATGSRLRTLDDLPGADDEKIFYLRRVGQSKRIRKELQDAERAVVIGGGFIGMETAAVLAEEGVETTLVFPDDHLMDDLFTPEIGDFFEKVYAQHNVKLVSNERVTGFERQNGLLHVNLASGQSIPTDMVVCGVGVEPETSLFTESDLEIDRGIVVDEYLETNIDGIFAAGDVTRYKDILFDTTRHVEHWDNAQAQASHAVKGMMGKREPFEHLPFFFSDQFDLSWEFWGDSSQADEIIVRGEMDSSDPSFSVWWIKDEKVKAAFVMDRPDEERQAAQDLIRSQDNAPLFLLRDQDASLANMKETA